LNYRHHFHAGNFADVMKHAVLLALITSARRRGPVRLVETHAGAGLYDLKSEDALRSGEAQGGVSRLMSAGVLPHALDALRQAVRRENPEGGLRFYPGSPLIALGALGVGDSYRGCELRPDDAETLKTLVEERAGGVAVQALKADGFTVLSKLLTGGELVLIDPPFERSDDYERAAEAVRLCLARSAGVAVWAPIKDLETLDALSRRIEALGPATLQRAQVRLRPLTNPLILNGSALLLVDAPDVAVDAADVCDWVAATCGEAEAHGDLIRTIG